MNLLQLVNELHLLVPYNGPNPEITSIENDNRKVKKGSLFICLKGKTVDGHDFANSAVENGASAIIAEKLLDLDVPVIVVKDTYRAMAVLADYYYGQPSHQIQLIGITGTNGKTTTSHLIEKIFSDQKIKTGLIGTMYTKILDEKIETKNTTPESLTLQKTFRKMLDKEVEIAVMEVSSHALDLGRVHGCDFDIAIFTNLSQDHLDHHKTMEDYKHAKGLLFSQLGNVFDANRPKYAILNADDETIDDYKKITAAHLISYGIDQEADIRATNIKLTAKGTEFDVVIGSEKYPISIQLVGKFNIYNTLASIAAALVSKIDMSSIITSLEGIEGVAGRFELVNSGQDFTVIVDYAHTPDSLENVLKTIQQITQKDIYVVVGCGGDRDKTKRPLMAKIACQYGTQPIFTSDNPRSENPEQILKDMEAGVQGEKYFTIVDRKQAIHYAISQAKTGDVVLIAGKGHETYQIIGDTTYDFDDRIVAKEAIEER
ncbi:UDP-N-acetylmuramoyl-L-alanyl-D-glutamate--2,6-diaminopimelate ligase [Neobacillus sp. D3-1R]|uniref:UDP-N-acetylmuramoyl-L-alanyl-D-glutamate--2, 6-diaminopimelate ligase n=1 Tax=Neobacillus sp. D3-1R TaxID=3445778 RepID=UPI003F9F03A7